MLVFGASWGIFPGAMSAPDWVRDCLGDALCFSRPANLIREPAKAIDSLTAHYRNETLELSLDLGLYSNSSSELMTTRREAMTIDGRPAYMLRQGKSIALVVPAVHEGQSMKVKLSMLLRFQEQPQPELARHIFQSIEFKPPR